MSENPEDAQATLNIFTDGFARIEGGRYTVQCHNKQMTEDPPVLEQPTGKEAYKKFNVSYVVKP